MPMCELNHKKTITFRSGPGMTALQTRPIFSVIHALKDLDDTELNGLQDKARWKRVPAGHELIRHMGAAHAVYFLCEGKMRARVVSASGREVGIRMIETGDVIGEMAVITGMPRNADVIAETECVIAEMDSEVFMESIMKHPTVLLNLLRATIELVSDANDRIMELSAINVRDRINAEILRLATHQRVADGLMSGEDCEHGGDVEAGIAITINPAPSHERIASFVGTTREAVTKQFSVLTKDGLISARRGEIVVNDYQALKTRVSQYVGEGASWYKNSNA